MWAMDFEKLVECSKSSVRQVKGWKGSRDRRKASLMVRLMSQEMGSLI